MSIPTSWVVSALLGVTLSVGGGLIHYYEPHEALRQFIDHPISSVKVHGSFVYLDESEVQQSVAGFVEQGLLDIDIEGLKRRLEQSPWVDTALVARKWPDVLTVEIVEQKPIARWGAKGFLNMRGDIIEVRDNSKLESLPRLMGSDRDAQVIMRRYLQFGKLFGTTGLDIASVQLDNTRSWTLQLTSGVSLKLGREQLLEKLRSFLVASRGVLASRLDEVVAVDLRYQNGFSVTWKSAETVAPVAMTGR